EPRFLAAPPHQKVPRGVCFSALLSSMCGEVRSGKNETLEPLRYCFRASLLCVLWAGALEGRTRRAALEIAVINRVGGKLLAHPLNGAREQDVRRAELAAEQIVARLESLGETRHRVIVVLLPHRVLTGSGHARDHCRLEIRRVVEQPIEIIRAVAVAD